MTDIKLKPCPFCGGKAYMRFQDLDDNPDGLFFVDCGNTSGTECPVNPQTDYFDTEAEAAEAWNTRHGETIHIDHVETLNL